MHDTTTDDRLAAGDLMTASALASKANSSREVTALFNTGDTRALDVPGTMTLDGHADYFQRPENRSVLDAAAVKRMAEDGTLTEYPQGKDPALPRTILYSWRDLLDALGIAPADDTATPAEDDDQPAEHPVSPSGAAIQLNVPEQTVKDLVAGGQVENQTLKDSTAPDIDRYKAPTVLVSEVQAVVERINGGQRPADLATPRGAAYEVGQGLTAAEVTAAIERAELTDFADQIAMTGKGPDGKATTEYAAAGGTKVSIAAVREWHATRQ